MNLTLSEIKVDDDDDDDDDEFCQTKWLKLGLQIFLKKANVLTLAR